MLKNKSKRAVIVYILAFISLQMLFAAEPEMQITKEDTIKIALFNRLSGIPLSIISRANPEAKSELLKLLSTNSPKANVGQIILMIGYIGDESDATILDKRLEVIINSDPQTKLTKKQRDEFFAISRAFGIMAYRGVPGVKNIVKKRIETIQWASLGEQSYDDEALKRQPHMKYKMAANFFRGYALSEDSDIEKYIEKFLSTIKNSGNKKKFRRFDYKRMKQYAAKFHKHEKDEIDEDYIKELRKCPKETDQEIQRRRAMKNAKKELSTKKYFKDDGYYAASINDAIKAYENIATIIVEDNSDGLVKCMNLGTSLLDNGEQIKPAKWASTKKEVAKAIGVEKSILTEVEKLKLNKFENFQIKIDADVKYNKRPDQSEESAQSPIYGTEIIIVTFVIPDTAEIYKKYIPRVSNRGAVTRDENGNLQVYMKKINGKWYWNPFAW